MVDKKLVPTLGKRTRPEEYRSGQVRRKRIGAKLKQIYDDVANEPVPDEFLKLLRDADEKPKP